MTIRALAKYAAAAAVLAVTFAGGTFTANALASPDEPQTPQIPHCQAEDGGPQPVCIWDSAVDGNGTPSGGDRVVILYVSRPGQDPQAYRLQS